MSRAQKPSNKCPWHLRQMPALPHSRQEPNKWSSGRPTLFPPSLLVPQYVLRKVDGPHPDFLTPSPA